MNTTKKLYQVLKRMRELTAAGIPFEIEFYSYQEKGTSEGLKHVKSAMLRTGLSRRWSDKADLLIGYKDGDKSRFFYLPLLIKFNQKYINDC